RPLIGSPRYAAADAAVSVETIRSPYTRDFVYRFQHQRGFGRLTMHALHADEELFCRLAWKRIGERTGPADVAHARARQRAARLRAGGVPFVINLPGEPHGRYAADLRAADALVADGWAASHLPWVLGGGGGG